MFKYILSKLIKKSHLSSIRNSKVDQRSKIEAGCSFVSSSIEKYSFCGYDCEIISADIGKFTSIANNVVIGGARHPMEWVGMSPVFYAGRDSINKKFSRYPLPDIKRTSIGNDVWIGRSAIILSGVCIGDGAVIGAGSVVTKDVPSYGIVAGNPASLIRYRFNELVIKKLQEIRWWDLSEQTLSKAVTFIKSPEEFIEFIEDNDRKI